MSNLKADYFITEIKQEMDLDEDKQQVPGSFQIGGVKFKTAKKNLEKFIASSGSFEEGLSEKEVEPGFESQLEHIRNLTVDDIFRRIDSRISRLGRQTVNISDISPHQVGLFIWLVLKYCWKFNLALSSIQNNVESWRTLSSLIPGTTSKICLFRWLRLKKLGLQAYEWTQSQSELLKTLVKQGSVSIRDLAKLNWRLVSEQLYLQNKDKDRVYRQPKQCREHWNCFLREDIKKGPWQRQEDQALLGQVIRKKGEKRWYQLSKFITGRTQNAIKNRYNLLISRLKKVKQNKGKSELQVIQRYLEQIGSGYQEGQEERRKGQPPQNLEVQEVKIEENLSVPFSQGNLQEQAVAPMCLPEYPQQSVHPYMPYFPCYAFLSPFQHFIL